MTTDMKLGLVIGVIVGAILGGAYQQYLAAQRLEQQLKDGYLFCHSQLHGDVDIRDWINEPKDLYIRHEIAECGWVGDTFQ